MANKFTPRRSETFTEVSEVPSEPVSADSANPGEIQDGKTGVSDATEAPDVSFDEGAVDDSKKAAPMVRVKTKVDHNCCIGGTRYFFKKGVQKNVPEHVKEILFKANLLMPL